MTAAALVLAQVLGFLSSLHALMTVRTAQGTIAWMVSLNALPIVAVPAYWVFGRSRFAGYVIKRQSRDVLADPQSRAVAAQLAPLVPAFAGIPGSALAGQRLAKLPYLGGNEVELLVDGEATFRSLFAGIAAARRDVLVQFYIVRDDRLGRELRDLLVAKARAGVTVRFLYDELGSIDLPRRYREQLAAAGVRIERFGSTRGWGNRLQLNFRNHRKIVVADGVEGWVGGLNVGDEYLGRDPKVGPWRDTHLRVAGPAALGLQLSFVEDWNWATGELLFAELEWPAEPRGDTAVLVLPSGPADRLETASLMYQQAIHGALRRIWIATPYFVPDGAVLGSLTLVQRQRLSDYLASFGDFIPVRDARVAGTGEPIGDIAVNQEAIEHLREAGSSDAAPEYRTVPTGGSPSAVGLAKAARGMLAEFDDRVITSLGKVEVPTLLIVGENDTPFLNGMDYMAQNMPRSRKVVIPNAGHAANIDQPEIFNQTVVSFLDEVVGAKV